MKMTVQELASNTGIKINSVIQKVNRASKKGLDYILIDSVRYKFIYEEEMSRGRGGKRLYFQSADATNSCDMSGLQSIKCEKNEKNNLKVSISELDKMNRIKAVNEFLACPAGFKKTLWGKELANRYGVSLKTLYEWASLVKDEKKIKVEEKDFSLEIDFSSNSFSKAALEWALGAWLHNPLATKQKIYEMLSNEASKRGWKIGSYQSFARLFDRTDIKILLSKAIGGDRLVKNEYVPYIMRDLNKYKSMELICGDQIVFDWQVYDENGEIVNPNAYIWVDMGSSMVIGVDVVMGRYNKLSVGRSLKMALEYGVPGAVYTDNGKPELSRYIEEIRAQLGGVRFCDFDDMDGGLVHKKARPRNSRAKPIEGIFNHIQRWMFESIVSELGGFGYRHYTKTNKDEWVKALAKQKQLMSWDVFVERFLWAIEKWNSHKIKDRNIVPEEKFFGDLEGVTRFDEVTLDYIFAPRRTLKVRNGWVQISEDGQKYTYSHPLLVQLNGESVDVRVAEDKKSAIISTEKGFLCEANLIEKIDPRDEIALKAAIEQQNKIVKAIRDAYSKYKNIIKQEYKINYYSSVAKKAKDRISKTKDAVKKIQMSDDELLRAM